MDETHGSWISGRSNNTKCNKSLDEEENKQTIPEILRNMVQADDDGKEMAKLYQQTGFAKAMDENNKKALDVMPLKRVWMLL